MSYIACGFYTPDYLHWLPALCASLDHYGCPHDFVETPRAIGGWEANTMRKAAEVAHAMSRHPDKTIIWLDVDCVVAGDLSPLAEMGADVSVFMNARVKRNGGYKLHAITRTIVLSPTRAAREFAERWRGLSTCSDYGAVDQTTFLLAMAASTGTSFRPLERKWSSVKGEAGIILHDKASADTAKIGGINRMVHWWWDYLALDPR